MSIFPKNLQEVDTYVFDYGGVVSFHYCEPWQGNLAKLLSTSPQHVRELLSETSAQGRDYRLGTMTRDAFWETVIVKTGARNVSIDDLEFNWANSYQIDKRMVDLMLHLRSKTQCQVGILSNSDQYRQHHIEQEHALSRQLDFVISSHMHGVVKPEKEAYAKVLELASRESTPHKVLYVDDREKNIIPAIEMNIQGYVFSTYEHFAQLLRDQGIL